MTHTVNIRPYDPRDFDKLCQIHDPARKNELALAGLSDAFLPLSIAAEREGLFDYDVQVAELDGKIAGFVAYSSDEITWLYVDTSLPRSGIGSALLEFALRHVSQAVSIEVLAGNTPAIGIYHSFGFLIKETLTGVMPGNEEFPVTVHVMSREV